jgi:peptide/nickel transport system substrate-binding protein
MEHNVRGLLYEPLLAEDRYKITPYLADSWEISKDGREYTFRLKPGIGFHNGKEMTSQDVEWSIRYTMEPKNRAYAGHVFKDVKSVEVLDNHRIKITMNQANASFLAHLASVQGLPVLPKDSLAPGEKPQRFPPGTGPFLFEDWKPEQRIDLRKFSAYWQKGIPHVDRLVIRPVRDDEIRLAALRSGDVDVIDRTPLQYVEKIKRGDLGNLKIAVAPASRVLGLLFNVSRPPFDKVEVRQAVAFALDKNELVSGTSWGLGVPINQKLDPASPWYFHIPDRKRELGKARALMEKADYPQGFKTVALTMAGNESTIQVVQSQLKEIGIELEITVRPFAPFMRAAQEGNFGVATWGGDGALDPDTNYYDHYRSEETRTRNFSRYKNPRVDQLLDEGRITMDPKRRQQIYREMVEIVIDEAPTIWTVLTPVVYAYRSYVKGFEVEPQGRLFSGDKGFPMTWLDQ